MPQHVKVVRDALAVANEEGRVVEVGASAQSLKRGWDDRMRAVLPAAISVLVGCARTNLGEAYLDVSGPAPSRYLFPSPHDGRSCSRR